jgi:hypothetical protein
MVCKLDAATALPSFSLFAMNGTSVYADGTNDAFGTLTISETGAAWAASIAAVGTNAEAVETAIEAQMGTGNDVSVVADTTLLHPGLDATDQSAFSSTWGPAVGAARPVTCNGILSAVTIHFAEFVAESRFANSGFFSKRLGNTSF